QRGRKGNGEWNPEHSLAPRGNMSVPCGTHSRPVPLGQPRKSMTHLDAAKTAKLGAFLTGDPDGRLTSTMLTFCSDRPRVRSRSLPALHSVEAVAVTQGFRDRDASGCVTRSLLDRTRPTTAWCKMRRGPSVR